MNTTTVAAGLLRLVCLMSLLFAAVPEGKGDTYDGVVVAHRISLTKPDPRKPFTSTVVGSNGESASCGAALHLADPSAQINSNTRFYLSAVIKFKSRTTGQWVAIQRPNVTHVAWSCMGRKYRDGYMPQSIGGAFNIILDDSVFTEVAEPDPNPNTGKAWIYGVHDGQVVTTKGAKVVLPQSVTEGDGGAILMNAGEGDFLVHPDPYFTFSELWVIGAEQSFSAGFINQYIGAKALAQPPFNVPFEIVVECKQSISVESALNVQNGCRTYPGYRAFRFPSIYCGNEHGAVRPEWVWTLTGSTPQVTLRRGQIGSWLFQSSTDLTSWGTLPAWAFSSVPGSDPFAEDRRDMTYSLPDWSQITQPPPDKVFYRVWSPAPLEPPFVLSRP